MQRGYWYWECQGDVHIEALTIYGHGPILPVMTTPPDPRHPIGVVVQRTGLSADLLRVWERRYGAVRPDRGAGGQRFYTDADVQRLRLLHAVTRAGRSIGQVAQLGTDELTRMAAEDAAGRPQHPVTAAETPDADRLIADARDLTVALDAVRLDALLRRAAAVLGTGAFIEDLAIPLLRRIGDEWHEGRLGVAHEHLASSVLHDIVTETMRSLVPNADAPRIVVATPAGERHVMGAAAAGATAATEGWHTVYLGADLPAAEIASAVASADARLVAVSLVHAENRGSLISELRELRGGIADSVPVWAGGAGAAALAPELTRIGIRVATSLRVLREELRGAGAGRGWPARPPG